MSKTPLQIVREHRETLKRAPNRCHGMSRAELVGLLDKAQDGKNRLIHAAVALGYVTGNEGRFNGDIDSDRMVMESYDSHTGQPVSWDDIANELWRVIDILRDGGNGSET